MIDPNNRPGGDTLILTAKSANKIQWFAAATLAQTADLDMPASTHEMICSPDGSKVYDRSMAEASLAKTRIPTVALKTGSPPTIPPNSPLVFVVDLKAVA